MNTEGLKLLFGYNHHVIGVNSRDLTQEESLMAPHPGGNCANWVLGHIVCTRAAVLAILGEKPAWEGGEWDRYKRGSAPITSREARPFPEIFQALDRSQESLMAGLARCDGTDLGSPGDEKSAAGKLAVLQFHEAYHAGQLGVLRRIAGKKGAIP
jgi:hypothetical protein